MDFPRPMIWVRYIGQDKEGRDWDRKETITFSYASWIILGPLKRNIQALKRRFTARNKLGIYAKVRDLAELHE